MSPYRRVVPTFAAAIVVLIMSDCCPKATAEQTLGTAAAQRGARAVSSADAWGPTEHGLQCRAKAAAETEQGMPLDVQVGLRCDPKGLAPGVTKLNLFLADASLSLVLVNLQTKETFTVEPYDPTQGTPVLDDGGSAVPLDGTAIKPLRTVFPLVKLGDALTPGRYECRVRFDFPGRRADWWWRGRPADWESFWKGAVASAPFQVEILKETPKSATFLLPKRLRLARGPRITFSKLDAEEVKVRLRNGYFVGTSISSDHGGSLQSGTPKPDDVNPIEDWPDYKGGDKKVTYTIEVFETADPPCHMWSPGPSSGGYRVLWKKMFPLSFSEAEIRKEMAPHR